MQLAKPQTVTKETEADKGGHEDEVLAEKSVQPPQLDVKEVKEAEEEDSPVSTEKKVDVPQETTTEEAPSLDPKEDVPTEIVADDNPTPVSKEEPPTQKLEEENHMAEPKEEVPNEAPLDEVSTTDETQPEAPIEEVDERPEPVQENAVAV